jgi:Mrp family chromosome partitioning ATPase
MAKKQPKVKAEKQVVEAEPLSLQNADGSPLVTFSAEVVQNFRRMITRLANASQLPARLAMIATYPEEGVTYTSLALATTLAHDWRTRVCVVELNWHRPGLLKLMPGLTSPGLAAVIEGTAPLADALVSTSVEGLMVLPAGDLMFGKRTSVARSAELAKLIDQLASKFDRLVFDIPAVRLTSDAIPLAALGNAACLVVRQGVTPSADIKRALDDVGNLPMLGVVLNRVRTFTPRVILNLIPQE